MDTITLCDIFSLNLWEDNYNQGDIDKIALSIARFGYADTLKAWYNTVMAGNHSLQALRLLYDYGEEYALDHGIQPAQWPVVGIYVSHDDNGIEVWSVPVTILDHLTESEATAFAIAHNNIARLAVSQTRSLSDHLTKLHAVDQTAFLATGFNATMLQALQAQITKKKEGLKPESRNGDNQDQPETDQGDSGLDQPGKGEFVTFNVRVPVDLADSFIEFFDNHRSKKVYWQRKNEN